MTTALVLAAGLGNRLRAVTDGPKWLVPVGDSCPMDKQLSAIRATPGIARLVVVTSGDDRPVRDALDRHRGQLSVDLVDNPDADRWNNWSSALLGLEAAATDDVVLLNSDLFADARWLRAGIVAISTSPDPALLIDGERPLTDEAMKVAGGDVLTHIGKTGVTEPVGEYVGMAWWPSGMATNLQRILRSYRSDPAAAQHWYEHAIGADMAADTTYRRVPAPSVDWVEIDDPADLDSAVRLAGRAHGDRGTNGLG